MIWQWIAILYISTTVTAATAPTKMERSCVSRQLSSHITITLVTITRGTSDSLHNACFGLIRQHDTLRPYLIMFDARQDIADNLVAFI